MHRTLSASLLVGGLALMLAGCSSAATPAPTATPTMAPTQTASTTQAPTEAPTAPPSIAPSASASASNPPAAQATVAPFTSVPADLDGAIPASINPATSCFPFTGTLPAGAVRGLDCAASGGVNLTYFQFDSSADLQTSFASDAAQYADSSATHTCATGDWAGTWTGTFPDGKKLTGPDFGLLCNSASTADKAFIEQVDPTVNVMMIAELDAKAPFASKQLDAARASLRTWWLNDSTIVSDESKAP